MKKERKKGEQKLALSFFCARKNGDRSRKFRRHQDSGHHSSVCRPNGFAAQDQSSKCRFPRSALQTSPYDVRKTTKIFFFINKYNLYVLSRNFDRAGSAE